jgi:hypothetical protein
MAIKSKTEILKQAVNKQTTPPVYNPRQLDEATKFYKNPPQSENQLKNRISGYTPNFTPQMTAGINSTKYEGYDKGVNNSVIGLQPAGNFKAGGYDPSGTSVSSPYGKTTYIKQQSAPKIPIISSLKKTSAQKFGASWDRYKMKNINTPIGMKMASIDNHIAKNYFYPDGTPIEGYDKDSERHSYLAERGNLNSVPAELMPFYKNELTK